MDLVWPKAVVVVGGDATVVRLKEVLEVAGEDSGPLGGDIVWH